LAQRFSSFSLSGHDPRDLSELGFSTLFRIPPDTGTTSDSIRIETTHYCGEELELSIFPLSILSDSTGWGLALKYGRVQDSMRLERFQYHSRDMEITANRREYRARARVPADRFRVTIPSTAVPVTL
jgi:hypothetical protein